jgi:AcrR family transcriptional regulator
MPPIPELEEIRKAQIMEAGLTTLSQKGIANTTLDDVCNAAGLSKGGLVHYYKTKGVLFSAVFEAFFESIFKKSAETMARFEQPLDQILSYDWLYDPKDPDATIGYPLLLDLMALAAHDEDFRLVMEGWINSWVGLLGSALERGIEQKTFKPMDVDAVAKSISAIYQGIGTRWYLARGTHTREWAIDTYHKAIMGVLSPHMT